MLSSRPKRYVNCSVQTDPEPNVACNQLSCPRATCAISSFDSNSSLSAKPQTAAENLVQPRTTGYKDAYSDSQASKIGVENLVLPSRQERKQSTIGYGRPSSLISSEKRMTSLPGTVSTGEILGRLDEQVRIASMPERGKFGALQLSQHSECLHVETFESTDITYHSMDSAQRLACRVCEPTRRYPADLPQTPSPPSSPDSVMIIGNEGQISGSFLRRPSIDDSGEPLHHIRGDFIKIILIRMDYLGKLTPSAYPCFTWSIIFTLCSLSIVRTSSSEQLESDLFLFKRCGRDFS
jgi:hypothetical protein